MPVWTATVRFLLKGSIENVLKAKFLSVIGFLVLACGLSAAEQGEFIFANSAEIEEIRTAVKGSLQRELFESILGRVRERVQYPGLDDPSATTQWWHHVSDYLTDAALVHVIRPSRKTDAWLRNNVLDIVRRPTADWAGPAFRHYRGGPMRGTLETAHICWAVGISLDLAGDLFSPLETEEIKSALREKGLQPCRRYLDTVTWYSNWGCVLLSGYAVAAAVLEDEEALRYCRACLPHILDHFETDGSFGESLQYGNYAAYAITILEETLLRAGVLEKPVLDPYGRMVEWAAYAMLADHKPVSWWPVAVSLPRTANFGDCSALFRPSGDYLMHIAARGEGLQASLASWLFDKTYLPLEKAGIHDLAGFGFINDFGFLSVLLASRRAASLSPSVAGLPTVRAFSAGDAFLRDAWGGHTVLAFRMPAGPRHDIEHVHGDFNSLILSYDGETLLTDPGHSCYRNVTRQLDLATASHNTCTFLLPDGRTLEQRVESHRWKRLDGVVPEGKDLVYLGGERLLCTRNGEVSVVASDAADFYGAPLQSFRRYIILCGSHVVFIVDHIKASEPIRTRWNWLLDNRDDSLSARFVSEGNLLAKKGRVGIRMNYFGPTVRQAGPVYALAHDAYHPLPGQFCEGRPGSGYSFSYTASEASAETVSVHVVAADTLEDLDGWTLTFSYGRFNALCPGKELFWSLLVDNNVLSILDASDRILISQTL